MRYENLSNLNISRAVEELNSYLVTTNLAKEDCVRCTLAIEEVLLHYQANFGEETPFLLHCGIKWGKMQFSLTIRGVAYNPFEQEEDEDYPSIIHSLMERMGLFPGWKYIGGKNVISMSIHKVQSSPLKKLGLSIVAAFVIYAITLLLPEYVGEWIYNYVVVSLSEVFTGILSAVAGPIIFCSITCSICDMGDVATFGKIGKRIIIAFVSATSVLTVLSCFWLVFIYPPGEGTMQSGDAFYEIYMMILDVIPTNILGCFVDNSPMQIVTLAIVAGCSLLALQKSSPDLIAVMKQTNGILQYVMENISANIHILVFLSGLGILLSNQVSMLLDAYLLLIYLVIAIVVATCYSIGKVCMKTGVSPLLLIRKLAPTFLIGLTTASSAAAFSTSIKKCKENLGISPGLANFGVPFGQVIYKPSFAIFFGVLGFYMYDAYNLEGSISMILMLLFLCVILSIALPTIPGGALIVISILFLQLGIPDEGLTLAIIILTIYDFPATAINCASLQMELLCTAKKLDLLDESILKSK